MDNIGDKQALLDEIHRLSPNSEVMPNPTVRNLRNILKSIAVRKAAEENIEVFWETEYPKKTFEGKIKWWASKMSINMKFYSQSGPINKDLLPEENISETFSPHWYDSALQRDSQFDKILIEVIRNDLTIIVPEIFYRSIGQPIPPELSSIE